MDSTSDTRVTNAAFSLPPDFLRRIELLVIAARKSQLGAAKGERRSRRKGSSAEFADYRDYVQGDDLRHIDWNIYGRLDAMYLKLFQEQEDLTVNLLIDTSKSMGYGAPNKLDFARGLAAAIGYIGLVSFDRVSVAGLRGDQVGARLGALRGKASARKLFAFLGALEAGGPTHLGPACRAHALRGGKGVSVLLSDFMDEDGFEEALKNLSGTGAECYAVQVLAPEEFDPMLSGDLKLVDSETGACTEISVSRALLARYRKNRDAFIERVRRYCHSRGMAHFLVTSDTPLEKVTLDILRKGGLLR